MRSAQRPGIVLLCTSIGALAFVAGSVIFASTALITLPIRKQFPVPGDDAAALYIYVQISER